MKKRLSLSILLTSVSTSALAYDINNFTLSGDIRTGWVSFDYGNPDGIPTINKGHKDSEGFYVIPKLSFL